MSVNTWILGKLQWEFNLPNAWQSTWKEERVLLIADTQGGPEGCLSPWDQPRDLSLYGCLWYIYIYIDREAGISCIHSGVKEEVTTSLKGSFSQGLCPTSFQNCINSAWWIIVVYQYILRIYVYIYTHTHIYIIYVYIWYLNSLEILLFGVQQPLPSS